MGARGSESFTWRVCEMNPHIQQSQTVRVYSCQAVNLGCLGLWWPVEIPGMWQLQRASLRGKLQSKAAAAAAVCVNFLGRLEDSDVPWLNEYERLATCNIFAWPTIFCNFTKLLKIKNLQRKVLLKVSFAKIPADLSTYCLMKPQTSQFEAILITKLIFPYHIYTLATHLSTHLSTAERMQRSDPTSLGTKTKLL